MIHLRRRIAMFFLAAALVISMAVPAFAAHDSFSFTVVGDQTQTFKVYTGASNVKTIPGNPATIMTDQNTTFPPDIANWALRLYYYSGYNSTSDAFNKNYTKATNIAWMTGYYTSHPAYLSGQNITNRSYYIGGRLDDGVKDPNAYRASGKFNADYTTP